MYIQKSAYGAKGPGFKIWLSDAHFPTGFKKDIKLGHVEIVFQS